MSFADRPAIFGAVAADYYAAGLPVIPLHYHDKMPIPKEWNKFNDSMPSPDVQAQWIGHLGDSNVGIVLGQQSGMCMVDIDTTDEALIQVLLKVLPDSPWVRIGKKGMVLAYKWSDIKTFRIKNTNGETIVEMLSSRTQVVLPPSIHPETQAPYTANCNLIDVVKDIVPLNGEIESILRGAIEDHGVELSHSGWARTVDYVAVGNRDVEMTRSAGVYAYAVTRGELSVKEAVSRMVGRCEDFTENVAGDGVDPNKFVNNMLKFIARDVMEKNKILPVGWDADLTLEEKKQMGLDFDDEYEEWEYDRLKEHLYEAFSAYDPDSNGRVSAINFVLKQVSRATGLSPLDQDRLFRYIVEAGQCRLTLSALRKQVAELSAGEIRGKDHTEIAQAIIKDLTKIEDIRFFNSKFWAWSGSDWKELERSTILSVIARDYGSYEAARRNSDHHGIMRVMSSLVPQLLCTQPVRGVNFANGFLTLEGKLIDHNPEFGMTYTLPFRYMPQDSGKAFRFFEFLNQCWSADPDYEDKMKAMQEMLCTTLFGIGHERSRAMLLYGPPKSGKSQMLTIAGALVPDLARSNCPPDTWNDKFAPASMFGKLINICGELSPSKRIDGHKFKSIVGGEEIDAQFKGQQIFSFKPTCTHWFASNHMPRTDDTSTAFNRRWLVLGFPTPVSSKDVVLNLGNTIVAEEREAIAAWAVEALPRLQASGDYTLPSSHVEIMEDVANMNNSVRFFIRESGKVSVTPCPEDEDGRKTSPFISEMKLHHAYWSFCSAAGAARAVGPRIFRQQMRDLAHELHFKLIMSRSAGGAPDPRYYGVTLVERRVV